MGLSGLEPAPVFALFFGDPVTERAWVPASLGRASLDLQMCPLALWAASAILGTARLQVDFQGTGCGF